MAVAIDTKALAHELIPRLQRHLDQDTRQRFLIHRLCAHATVIHVDDAAYRRLLVSRERLARQEALDFDDHRCVDGHCETSEVEEGQVFQHLRYQAATSPLLLSAKLDPRTTATTTLVASALSPSFPEGALGRALSSFRRYSLRCSCLKRNQVLAHGFAYSSAIPEVFPTAVEHYAWVYFPEPNLNIIWAGSTGHKPVVWNMQLDVVDLWTRVTTVCINPQKRRRTAVSPFLGVSQVALNVLEGVVSTGGEDIYPDRRFKGVRRRFRGKRGDRERFVAEMTPYKGKGKVQFGEFQSAEQAASAVDAAYYYYDKPEDLNFPDSTPQILSSRPKPPVFREVDEVQFVEFVKKEAKWLARDHRSSKSTPVLPADNPLLPSQDPQAWSSGLVDLIWLRSSSDITCGGGGVDDFADDGSSLEADPVMRSVNLPINSVYIAEGWDDIAADLDSSGNCDHESRDELSPTTW